jgi:hypothetical protein
MRWWHSLAAALVLTAAGLQSPTEHGQASADARRALRFASDGSFRAAIFADLHYGENAWTDWGPAQDAASDGVMAAVLDAETPGPMPASPCSFLTLHLLLSTRIVSAKFTFLFPSSPDLVVYLGDVVTANNLPIPNASLYWDRAISPARSRGVPWATVFGNHDDMPFQWPLEWFSPAGVPPVRCPPASTSASASGRLPPSNASTSLQ